MNHLPFVVAHHVAKHAVAAHVIKHGGAVAHSAAGHLAASHAGAMHASSIAKVSAHGAVASKHMATGAAAKHAVVHSAHGTLTPASGQVIKAVQTKAVIQLKNVAKHRIVTTKPFRPVVPPAPHIS